MTNRPTYPSFITDVAHELRTPLTSIQGCAEMALNPDISAAQRNRSLQLIVDECARLAHLTIGILTIQQIEDGTIAFQSDPVNLRYIIYTAVALCGFTANEPPRSLCDDPLGIEAGGSGKGIDLPAIRVAAPDRVPRVMGDSAYLRCAVSHLIENAVRFTQPSGNIDILLSSDAKHATITVSDDGCGFSTIDPDLLFVPFFRADSSRQRETGGAGLGLSYVKAVAERHGGFVHARNLPEGGARFTIALPIASTSKESFVTAPSQLLQSA